MSNRLAVALLAAGFLLAGCSGSSSDGIGPTDPTSGNGAPPTPPSGVGDFVPLFRPTSGVLPFPIDLYFSGSTDGTCRSGSFTNRRTVSRSFVAVLASKYTRPNRSVASR